MKGYIQKLDATQLLENGVTRTDSYILFMTRHRPLHFEWCTLNTEEEHQRVSKPDTDDVVPRVYFICLDVASEKNIQVPLHASPMSQNAHSCADVLVFHYRTVYT